MARNQHTIEKMQPVWDDLRVLIQRFRSRGARQMSPDDIARLEHLYRQSTIHLAQLRSRSTNQKLIEQVNHLVADAHSLIYAAPRDNFAARIVRFYLTGFSRSIARTWKFHAASFLIFIIGVAGGYYASMRDPMAAYSLMMTDDFRMPGSSAEQLEAVLRSGRDYDATEKLQFMTFLLTHNTKVGFRAVAWGILCGVPTFFLMLYTGGFMGAFTAVHAQKGVVAEWWAWILPHGVTEIGAVILCGGAGLLLGMAIVHPGKLTRRASLVRAGRETLRVSLGVIPMFILAGFIESFVRQSHWTTDQRFAFALATLIAWAIYFTAGAIIERRQRLA